MAKMVVCFSSLATVKPCAVSLVYYAICTAYRCRLGRVQQLHGATTGRLRSQQLSTHAAAIDTSGAVLERTSDTNQEAVGGTSATGSVTGSGREAGNGAGTNRDLDVDESDLAGAWEHRYTNIF